MPTETYRLPDLKPHLDGRTVKWLAGKTQISVDRLYRLTQGKAEPTAGELKAISEAIGVSAETLLHRAA